MNPVLFILQVLAGQGMMIIDLLKVIVVLLSAILCMNLYNQFDMKTKRQRLTQGGRVILQKIDRKIVELVDNRK